MRQRGEKVVIKVRAYVKRLTSVVSDPTPRVERGSPADRPHNRRAASDNGRGGIISVCISPQIEVVRPRNA